MSKKLFISLAPLFAVAAFAVTSTAQAANGTHYYSGGKKIAEGAKVPVVAYGTLSLTSAAGTIKCSNVAGGYVENPSGGGAGKGATEEFGVYNCSGTCPVENRVEPFKLPWISTLQPNETIEGKVRNRASGGGIEVVTGCWNLKGEPGVGTGPNGGQPSGPGYSETGGEGTVSERGEPFNDAEADPLPLLHFAGEQSPYIVNGTGTGPKASVTLFKKETGAKELVNANVGPGTTAGSVFLESYEEGGLITTGP